MMSEPNYKRMSRAVNRALCDLDKLSPEECCRVLSALVVMYGFGDEIVNRLGYNGPIKITRQTDASRTDGNRKARR